MIKPIRTDYGEIPSKVAMYTREMPYRFAQEIKNLRISTGGSVVVTPSYVRRYKYDIGANIEIKSGEYERGRKGYIIFKRVDTGAIAIHVYSTATYTGIKTTTMEVASGIPIIHVEEVGEDFEAPSNPSLVGGGILIFGLSKAYCVGNSDSVAVFVIKTGAVAYSEVSHPKDGVIFQNRLFIWCEGPSVLLNREVIDKATKQRRALPEASAYVVRGVRLIGSTEYLIDDFTVTQELISAIEYKMYLKEKETILAMSALGGVCMGVSTNKRFFIVYSGETIVEGITAANINSKDIYEIECVGVRAVVMINMVFIFTASGIYYRRLESLTETLQNIFDTFTIKVYDSEITVKQVVYEKEQLKVVYERGVKGFPPIITALENRWLVPSTTYIENKDIKVVGVNEAGGIYVQNGTYIDVYTVADEPVPLTFYELLTYKVTINKDLGGGVYELGFPTNITAALIKGVWILKNGTLGYLEREAEITNRFKRVNSSFSVVAGVAYGFIVTTEDIKSVYGFKGYYAVNVDGELYKSDGIFKLPNKPSSELHTYTSIKEYEIVSESKAVISWDELEGNARPAYELNCCPNFQDVVLVEGAQEMIVYERHSVGEVVTKDHNKHSITTITMTPKVIATEAIEERDSEYAAQLPGVFVNFIE